MRILSVLPSALLAALFLIIPLSFAQAANVGANVSDVAAGKAAFAVCASCHQVGRSARGGFGPQLNGIIGRPAADTKDFKYSEAMKNSKIVWSEEKLRAYIKSPDDVVPGNKMRFFGIGNDREIDNLLAYLRTFQ